MASLNKVQLIGNIGRAPELKCLPSGSAVVELSVATTSRRKDKNTGETIEDTQWHRVTFYDRLAEIVGEYATRGRQVYIEARLDYGQFEKNGVTHYTTKLIGREFQLLGAAPAGARTEPPAGAAGDQDDDVPY